MYIHAQLLSVVVSRCQSLSILERGKRKNYISKSRALYYDRRNSSNQTSRAPLNGDAIHTTRISPQVVNVLFRLVLSCLVLSWPIQYSGTSVHGGDRPPNDEKSICGELLPGSVNTPEGGAGCRHHRYGLGKRRSCSVRIARGLKSIRWYEASRLVIGTSCPPEVIPRRSMSP